MSKEKPDLGDMSAGEFRRYGHQLIDWVSDYLAGVDRYPVLSRSSPGDLTCALPESPPEEGEEMERILEDLDRLILPGITHWNHPGFFSYFSITGSGPGILGELVSAALNVNGMLWRTSPAATELEERVLAWLRDMLGLPPEYWGIIYDTASISSFHALAAARERVPGLEVRKEGLCSSPKRLRFYASEQAHSSIDKAALALGIGLAGIRKISTDSAFRMDHECLSRAIEEDQAQGWTPFAVVGMVGTTSTTSVDPIPRLAEICAGEGLWLHVDAAYAGPAAIVPELRWVLEGCCQADSIVVNPHKWLFTPIDCSVLFCRQPDVLRRAFSIVPDYLTSSESATNLMDYGLQLGRRFRALKLWMVIRYFGRTGIQERIRQHVKWAGEFAQWVDSEPDFERLAPTPLSTICFRAVPAGAGAMGEEFLEGLNQQLLDEVNRDGRVFLSHTRLRGKLALRLAIGNLRTTREHVEKAWEILRSTLRKLAE